MSGYTEWCVLCWGQRLRDDYPGLVPKVVGEAGGAVIKGKSGCQVLCLPGTYWITANIRTVDIDHKDRIKRAIALRRIEKKLGIKSKDCIEVPGWHLLLGATVEAYG